MIVLLFTFKDIKKNLHSANFKMIPSLFEMGKHLRLAFWCPSSRHAIFIQFKSLTGKLAAGLLFLKKLKDAPPQSKLCDVYRALFESHIRYGNVVWGSLPSAELQSLHHLQNRARSIIASARYKDLGLKLSSMLRTLFSLINLFWLIRF